MRIGSVDLIGWIVAAGALALVLVTLWYAKTTRAIQQQNKDLVRATRAMTRVAAESLILQTAPLVLVRRGEARWHGGRGNLKIDYRNVGHGPAVNTRFEIQINDRDSIELAARDTIGVGEDGSQEISLGEEQTRAVRSDRAHVTFVSDYQDSPGNRYRTVREPLGSISFIRFGAAGEEIQLELTQATIERWLEGT